VHGKFFWRTGEPINDMGNVTKDDLLSDCSQTMAQFISTNPIATVVYRMPVSVMPNVLYSYRF
jgi:hypothetical protein